MNISILSIGDELLIGQVVNTNASWLAEQLTLSGFQVCCITTAGDKMPDITDAFASGLSKSDVLLVTGGLGPTSDDLTREALCTFYKCKMHSDPVAVEDIRKIFSQRGMPLTEVNMRQAEIPDKCKPIYNPIGTSPGMWFEEYGKILIAMPGVPFEMEQMFSRTVLPKLVKKFNPRSVFYRNVLTQGIGESFLSERIRDWENDLPGEISLAYLPQPGIVKLRLLARGDKTEDLKALINEQVDKLKKVIPEFIFGYDDDTLEAVIGKMLVSMNATLSTAESCTGGYIAHLITSVPGSSRYYKGSVIAYDNEIKIKELDVQREILEQSGAVSREVAIQMAEGIKRKFQTDYSIAVTGIAGPDGGTKDKPVGLVWIAVCSPYETILKQENFGDNRGRHIQRTAITALNMLRSALLK